MQLVKACFSEIKVKKFKNKRSINFIIEKQKISGRNEAIIGIKK
jgi:hypothetical protein